MVSERRAIFIFGGIVMNMTQEALELKVWEERGWEGQGRMREIMCKQTHRRWVG